MVEADLFFPSCPLPTGHLCAHGYVPQRQDQPWLWGQPRGPHDATTWFPPLAPTQGPTPTLLKVWGNRSMDLRLSRIIPFMSFHCQTPGSFRISDGNPTPEVEHRLDPPNGPMPISTGDPVPSDTSPGALGLRPAPRSSWRPPARHAQGHADALSRSIV